MINDAEGNGMERNGMERADCARRRSSNGSQSSAIVQFNWHYSILLINLTPSSLMKYSYPSPPVYAPSQFPQFSGFLFQFNSFHLNNSLNILILTILFKFSLITSIYCV